MPRRDGKGPIGQGQFTGKGLGYCITKLEDSDNSGQKKSLEEEKDILESRLNIINEKLKDYTD